MAAGGELLASLLGKHIVYSVAAVTVDPVAATYTIGAYTNINGRIRAGNTRRRMNDVSRIEAQGSTRMNPVKIRSGGGFTLTEIRVNNATYSKLKTIADASDHIAIKVQDGSVVVRTEEWICLIQDDTSDDNADENTVTLDVATIDIGAANPIVT